ncbi:Wzz/FepE/Etk N-terminal domain-containing protein [Piscinibacter sakaiensis]|uniref:Wzz/FepE/Etk N-terminal domain-containing protein n=1 Tax=Piscinibacter sakaiensis TaxID=1547922 RepID=UPI00372A49F3
MTGPAPLFPVRPDAPDGEFTLRDLLRLVAKHGWVVLVCLLAGGLVGAGIYAIQKPVYASVARVWVKTEQGSPSFLSGVTAYREPLYPDPVNRRIETEMELMLTRTSAAQVVRNLKVRPEQLPSTPLAQLIAASGLVAAKPASDGAASNRLIDDFLKAVSVEPLRSKTADTTSNILEVRFEASDPALAPQALSQLISNYLGVAATQNRQLGEEAARLLGAEVEQARGELPRPRRAAASVRARNGASAANAAASAAAGARTPSPVRRWATSRRWPR